MAEFTGWYDQARAAAELAKVVPSGGNPRALDAQTLLGLLNPLSGITGAKGGNVERTIGAPGEGDAGREMVYSPGQYQGPNGQLFWEVADPTGADPGGDYIQWSDNNGGGMEAPGGNEHNRLQPIYKLDAQGNATPVSAGSNYKAGAWTDYGRDLAKWAAVMATAGTAGSYLAGAGAAGGAGGGAAAGAAGGAGSGTGALGYGVSGYVAPSAGQFAVLTVAQLDAAAAGLGGAAGAGAAGGAAAPTSGVTAGQAASGASAASSLGGGGGSAPAYSGPGSAGAGAGSDAIVNGSSGGGSWWDSLTAGNYGDAAKSAGGGLLDWATKNPGQAVSAGSLLAGLLADQGGSGSDAAGGGAGYAPKAIPRGTWQSSVTPQYGGQQAAQPQQQPQGLLANPQGQANDGLWRFNKKSGLLGA